MTVCAKEHVLETLSTAKLAKERSKTNNDEKTKTQKYGFSGN